MRTITNKTPTPRNQDGDYGTHGVPYGADCRSGAWICMTGAGNEQGEENDGHETVLS